MHYMVVNERSFAKIVLPLMELHFLSTTEGGLEVGVGVELVGVVVSAISLSLSSWIPAKISLRRSLSAFRSMTVLPAGLGKLCIVWRVWMFEALRVDGSSCRLKSRLGFRKFLLELIGVRSWLLFDECGCCCCWWCDCCWWRVWLLLLLLLLLDKLKLGGEVRFGILVILRILLLLLLVWAGVCVVLDVELALPFGKFRLVRVVVVMWEGSPIMSVIGVWGSVVVCGSVDVCGGVGVCVPAIMAECSRLPTPRLSNPIDPSSIMTSHYVTSHYVTSQGNVTDSTTDLAY